MITRGLVKKGAYFDSVALMIVSKEIKALAGIIDSSVVMGSEENRKILRSAQLFPQEFEHAGETDLLIAVKAEDEKSAAAALDQVDELLKKTGQKREKELGFAPKSLISALEVLPEANLALISVAGKYAAQEARQALANNLHVMIFSDNVPLTEEIALKKQAAAQGLFVMGPDCGTAIINGVPLAFANKVKRGSVGIVSASGTGLQEVSCILSNLGAGISQALGTGGRDIKREVGGIMFLKALEALQKDEGTQIIVLIAKPPHPQVLARIAEKIKSTKKPVVAVFLGADPAIVADSGALYAENLEAAALMAASLAHGKPLDAYAKPRDQRKNLLDELARTEARNKRNKQKYARGLFSGGTLCAEAQLILNPVLGDVYSNTPLKADRKLTDSFQSQKNSLVDFGEDEFTQGRPHPMIDFSLRNRHIVKEAGDQEVAVLLLDLLLGYGAHPDPAADLIPSLQMAKQISPELSIICSVTGTDQDPQNKEQVQKALLDAGVKVLPSNAAACELAGKIINKLMGDR